MFKIFRVSIENFEFWLSQTVDFLFSLSTPFFSLFSLSLADSPPLRAQAFRHAARAPAAALSRCLPPLAARLPPCCRLAAPSPPPQVRTRTDGARCACPPWLAAIIASARRGAITARRPATPTRAPPRPLTPRSIRVLACPLCHARALALRDAAIATSEPGRRRAFTPRPSPAELPPPLLPCPGAVLASPLHYPPSPRAAPPCPCPGTPHHGLAPPPAACSRGAPPPPFLSPN